MKDTLMFKTISCRRCDYEKDINYYEDYDFCPECDESLTVVSRSGICDKCGCEVVLNDPLTNECACGALYNAFGQSLAPRDEWGDDCKDNGY